MRRYLTATAITKDEPDLREWVAYHRVAGVEKFLIYDNCSSNPAAVVLQDFIKQGFVEVKVIEGAKMQSPAYQAALERERDHTRWHLFIDVDEFLLPNKVHSIPELLEQYEPYASVAFNWLMFGSSGHVQRPPGLCIESYMMRSPHKFVLNHTLKVCVDPARATGPLNPHCFLLKPGEVVVNSNHQALEWSTVRGGTTTAPPVFEQAQLNHYYMKSREDWDRKLRRGTAYSLPPRAANNFDQYDPYCNDELDTEILRFLPLMRKLLVE